MAPFTLHQTNQLDVEFASIVRKCCHFSPGTASASIHFGKDHGGLGVRSLAQDYTQVSASNLARVVNDPGTLGTVTKALWQQQHLLLADMPVDQLSLGWHHSTLARQHCLLGRANFVVQQGPHLNRHPSIQDITWWSIVKQCLKNPVHASMAKMPHKMPHRFSMLVTEALDIPVTHCYGLVQEGGTMPIPAVDLLKVIRCSRTITLQHIKTLYKLTLAIHESQGPEEARQAGLYKHRPPSIPLPAEFRQLPSHLSLNLNSLVVTLCDQPRRGRRRITHSVPPDQHPHSAPITPLVTPAVSHPSHHAHQLQPSFQTKPNCGKSPQAGRVSGKTPYELASTSHDGHLTNLQRQGCWTPQLLPQPLEKQKITQNRLRQSAIIDTQPCDPDRDLV
jgi:hypothetical protein